jgi:hypothetical protein
VVPPVFGAQTLSGAVLVVKATIPLWGKKPRRSTGKSLSQVQSLAANDAANTCNVVGVMMFDFVKKMKDSVDRLLADPVQDETSFSGPVIKMTTPKVVTSPELFDTSAKELQLLDTSDLFGLGSVADLADTSLNYGTAVPLSGSLLTPTGVFTD